VAAPAFFISEGVFDEYAHRRPNRRQNQQNAQHSIGPATEAGKAASCKNNFRHGLTGNSFATKRRVIAAPIAA
jgi:hypothetical protein